MKVNVEIGSFFYVDPNNQPAQLFNGAINDTRYEHEPFIIRTVEAQPDYSAVGDRRVDDMNDQFEKRWLELEAQGCTNIVFAEITPHPLLGAL